MAFWQIYVIIHIVLTTVTIFWFCGGGLRDLRAMLRRLASSARNDEDDGFVRVDSNSASYESEQE